ALVIAACGGGEAATTASTAGTATTEAPATTAAPETTAGATTTTVAAAAGAELVLASTDLGEIITDPEGRTLYLFMPDEQGDPTCYDTCAGNWPALTAEVSAGAGLDAALMGTATRTNGGVQVTYNGWPLYYFAGDSAPGDINGQGVGEIWWVVGADGEAITG
ncbi:MAG: COG4315 family predicted lipoprotein, partial [Acidimicrobiia bacterium]